MGVLSVDCCAHNCSPLSTHPTTKPHHHHHHHTTTPTSPSLSTHTHAALRLPLLWCLCVPARLLQPRPGQLAAALPLEAACCCLGGGLHVCEGHCAPAVDRAPRLFTRGLYVVLEWWVLGGVGWWGSRWVVVVLAVLAVLAVCLTGLIRAYHEGLSLRSQHLLCSSRTPPIHTPPTFTPHPPHHHPRVLMR